MITTSYLGTIFTTDKFKICVDVAVKDLTAFGLDKFEAIAFTGVSGAALAFPLSYLLNKPLLCVRKETCNSHFITDSYNPSFVEGDAGTQSYIIVDDFITTGNTINYINRKISDELGFNVKFIGYYLYKECDEQREQFGFCIPVSHKNVPYKD